MYVAFKSTLLQVHSKATSDSAFNLAGEFSGAYLQLYRKRDCYTSDWTLAKVTNNEICTIYVKS